MQELGKLNFNINVIPKESEKYISFNVSNNLIFIDSIFLSSSLDNLVKNLCKYDFKYFSQEFDSKVLELVKKR